MRHRTVVIVAALCLGAAASVLANLVIISISTIEPNQRISGFVSGLSDEQERDHKVVVYVHTDQWHIQPATEAAKSFAKIGADGTWQLKTVRGKSKADKVGAIVVPAAFTPPAKIERLAEVPHVSITIRNIQGTPDDGKL